MTSSEMRKVGFSFGTDPPTLRRHRRPSNGLRRSRFRLLSPSCGKSSAAAASRRRSATIPVRARVRHQPFVRGGGRTAEVTRIRHCPARRGRRWIGPLSPSSARVGEQPGVVAVAGPQAERRHAVDRHELLHRGQVLARLQELRADGRLDRGGAGGRRLEHRVDRRERHHEVARGLLADAADARAVRRRGRRAGSRTRRSGRRAPRTSRARPPRRTPPGPRRRAP